MRKVAYTLGMSENIKQGGKSKRKARKNLSIDPDLWEEVATKARKNQQSVSALVSAFFRDWLAGRYKPTGED